MYCMDDMETACLRIRFTPLWKNLYQEDSKHFLEIVPEITCVQNLDKIHWRKDEHCIEYSIPMTYKVILRKKEICNDSVQSVFREEPLERTYHSCVDLLLSSSDANLLTLGSGDINKIVSDTFVLTKVTTDFERCSILLKENNKFKKKYDSIELATTQVQTNVNSIPSITSQLEYNELIDHFKSRENAVTQTSAEVLQSESLTLVTDSDILDRIKQSISIVNTELSSNIHNPTSVRGLDTAKRSLTVNSQTETKCKLSITPIWSIDTDDKQPEPDTNGIKTIVFNVYESHNSFDAKEKNAKNNINNDVINDVYDGNTIPFKVLNKFDYVNSYRILPEIRVANFRELMEKEIMPLKEMLGDIMHKCFSLGFIRNRSQQKSFICKTVPNFEKQYSRSLKAKKQSQSNRVVYSIVFDG